MKKIIVLFIFMLFTLILTSCGSENSKLDKIIDKGEIVIITSPDYAPFEFIDTEKSGMDQYIGADIELMKYIAKELGVTLKLEIADFNTTLASLGLGTVDLAISGFTYEQERDDNYALSVPYYNEGNQGVLVLKENFENLNSLEELNVNHKIGAQAGSMQADYVEVELSNATLENFVSIPDGITLLNNKIVNGVSISEKVTKIIMEKHPDKYAFVDNVYTVDTSDTAMFVVAKKGEVDLISKINEIIAKVVAEDLYTAWDIAATARALELGLL